ncbi:MAG: hypothetical protein ACRYFZ_01440 [Janthinobacterium lividum]
MKKLICLLISGLLSSQLANAQTVKSKGTLIVDAKLVSRFIKQTYLLRKVAISQSFKKKVSSVPDWLIPSPGDKLVTYSQQGDTLWFYQSGQTATLLGCSLNNATHFAEAVPFLASTKEVLFAGKHKTRNVFTVTDSAVLGQYMLILKFQGNHIRHLLFNLDTSTF